MSNKTIKASLASFDFSLITLISLKIHKYNMQYKG